MSVETTWSVCEVCWTAGSGDGIQMVILREGSVKAVTRSTLKDRSQQEDAGAM